MKKRRYLFLGAQINWDTNYLVHKLETMAKQGWKLTKVGAVLTFKRAEPEDLQFQVDYLGADMTWASSEDSFVMDYRQICEDSGWEYRGNNQQLFIFSAPKDKKVIPLQTDEELKRQTLISLMLKNNFYLLILPLLIIFNNGLTFDSFILTSYSTTITFMLSWIMVTGLFIYNILNILQILYLKKYFHSKVFHILPTLIRKTIYLTVIGTIFLLSFLFLTLILESTSFGLALSILFTLSILGLCSYICTRIMKKSTFSHQKKIMLTGVCLILTTIITIHSTIILISSTPITKKSDLHLEYAVLNEEPLQLNRTRDIYLERRSSFVFSDYLTVNDGHLDFDYYRLRSSVLADKIITTILNDSITYDQYLQASNEEPFIYEIYKSDSNELTGYILYANLNLLIFDAQAEDLSDTTFKEAIFTLFMQLSNH